MGTDFVYAYLLRIPIAWDIHQKFIAGPGAGVVDKRTRDEHLVGQSGVPMHAVSDAVAGDDVDADGPFPVLIHASCDAADGICFGIDLWPVGMASDEH